MYIHIYLNIGRKGFYFLINPMHILSMFFSVIEYSPSKHNTRALILNIENYLKENKTNTINNHIFIYS